MVKNAVSLAAALAAMFLLTWAAIQVMGEIGMIEFDYHPEPQPEPDPADHLVWQVLREAREITRKAAEPDDAE